MKGFGLTLLTVAFVLLAVNDNAEGSIKEEWEKIKDDFKDLKIDLKENDMKFREWVKENLDKAKIKGKDTIESIKNIAKDFIAHLNDVTKETLREALEVFRPYREDLGVLWDQIVEKLKNS